MTVGQTIRTIVLPLVVGVLLLGGGAVLTVYAFFSSAVYFGLGFLAMVLGCPPLAFGGLAFIYRPTPEPQGQSPSSQ